MSVSECSERTPLLVTKSATQQRTAQLHELNPNEDDTMEVVADVEAQQPNGFSFKQKVLLCNLGGANLLSGCIVAVMIPFFPLEAAVRGVSSTVTGAVFSCFALTQLLAYPFMGRIIPVFGATRVMNWGLALTGTSTIAFGALNLIPNTQVFISACFLMRIVEALGSSALNTAIYTIVANTFGSSTGFAIGIIETMTGVGISLGPAIGGALYNLGGYGTPFYVLGVIIVIMSCVNLHCMPLIDDNKRQKINYIRMMSIYFRSLDILICNMVILTVSINWTTIDPSIAKYVYNTMGITPAQLGYYFLISTGLFTLTGIFWGRLSDRLNNIMIVTTCSLLGVTAGLILLPPLPFTGLAPNWWIFGIGITTKELFQGGTFVPLFGQIHKLCLRQGMDNNLITQSFVSSMFFTFFSIGNVLGPTLGGVVNDAFGFPLMVACLAIWTVLMACSTAFIAIRTHLKCRE